MQHDMKKEGLLQFLTIGILKHSQQDTALQLGDRSKYIGLSDIGKGLECLRSAVASKAGITQNLDHTDVSNLTPEELRKVLGKQIILQRGHWQEFGIQNAMMSTGVKLVPQLEISIEYKGIPIKAHLDFCIVWGGVKPAIRVIELKSNENIPDNLYASYEAQLYGQVGLLKECWDKPCFSVTAEHNQIELKDVTFPEAAQLLFGVDMPATPENMDIEAWVLSISMSEVRPFGPYLPDKTMLKTCLQIAERIWNEKTELLSGNIALNDINYCSGFHPLCDWCNVNEDCLKFKGQDALAHDPDFGTELEILASLKEQESALKKKKKEIEQRIKNTYHLINGNNAGWLRTENYRFKVSTMPGRKSLDQDLLHKQIEGNMSNGTTADAMLDKCQKTSAPYERLYVSKINKRKITNAA